MRIIKFNLLYKYLAVVKNIDNGGIAMERKNIFDRDKSSGKKLTYYIVLGICVLVIGAASFLSYKSIQLSLIHISSFSDIM